MMNGYDMSNWGWGWMSLWMIIGTLLVVLLIYAVARGTGGSPAHQPEPDALETLRRRYAKGEIDEAEYLRRRDALIGRDGGLTAS